MTLALTERQLPMDIETLTLEVIEWVSVYHRSNENRIQAALESGKRFVAAKPLLGHGKFGPWLKMVGADPRGANHWMCLSEAGLQISDITNLGGLRAALDYLRKQNREANAAEKDAELLALTPSSDVDLHHLAVSELHTVVPTKSVDVIFTDPPYPREYLPVWSELAAFASHALKPSGVLVAMSGQSYLPEVMASLGEHLTYRWTMAYLMPGADTTIWPRKIKTRWKPVLVYGAAEEWLAMDVVHADTLKAQDDRFHQWGQQAPGMVRLLEPFVKPGYVVCDPFVGGGTAALAAQVHGCAFIGADSDVEQLDTTRKRLNVVKSI